MRVSTGPITFLAADAVTKNVREGGRVINAVGMTERAGAERGEMSQVRTLPCPQTAC